MLSLDPRATMNSEEMALPLFPLPWTKPASQPTGHQCPGCRHAGVPHTAPDTVSGWLPGTRSWKGTSIITLNYTS